MLLAGRCCQEREQILLEGGKMTITPAGAMNNAELGISLAEFIRQGKVDIISTNTSANLKTISRIWWHIPIRKEFRHYRELRPKDEWELLEGGYNRVTDTCIPEEEAFRRIQ
ncbi:MAG: hypothetical protein IPP46_06140 [Bacteroidetes bacterium]|nr:hypothetical protein [Bacteroidota bacterium]